MSNIADSYPMGSDSSNMADQPWVPVLIPLVVIIGVSVLASTLAIVHRRHSRSQAMYLRQQHGRQALERDLEERITRGYRGPGTATAAEVADDSWVHLTSMTGPAHGRSSRARTANRWAWANNLALGRREEGLNELGEAPPPYEQRSGSVHKIEATSVEMSHLRPTMDGRAVAGSAERAARAAAGVLPSTPPAYTEGRSASGGPPTRTAVLSQPAPAVLPPERLHHLYG